MDFINIIGTFFDNSIEHVVALAHLIKDLRLNKNQQDINEEFENNVSTVKENIKNINESIEDVNTFVEDLNRSINICNRKLKLIEEEGVKPADNIKHVIISPKAYSYLEKYEKDTLYIIVDSKEYFSTLGDTFPFVLGGELPEFFHFGEEFPVVLEGSYKNVENNSQSNQEDSTLL